MKTYKDFIAESKKGEKLANNILHSEDGMELAVAFNDGDEKSAERILKRHYKTPDVNAALAYMFP